MGKKILIGCSVLALVGVIAGGLGGYFFLWRPASEYMQSFSDLGRIAEINQQVENSEAYTPPQDGLLTSEQVDRFVRVQRTIVEQMGSHVESLRQKYEELSTGVQSGQANLNFGELAQFWKDFSGTIIRVKEVQVEALNTEGFSTEEYAWIRSEFYKSLGANFFSVNLDKITQAIEEQDPSVLEGRERPDIPVPQENRELVGPYEEEARQWLTYAWLGL